MVSAQPAVETRGLVKRFGHITAVAKPTPSCSPDDAGSGSSGTRTS